jgi:hypothetical protein
MHLELLIPDLIAPTGSAAQGLSLPSLQLLLGRGRRQVDQAMRRDDWLSLAAGLDDGAAAPLAAISALGDGIEPAHHGWLRADPVNLRAERDQLLLDPLAASSLTHEEAVQLVATLNAHFLADGMRFCAVNARKWYVQTDTVPQVVMAPLAAAAAAANNVDAMRPQGADAMAWQRIANEAQMLLHEHPVNAAREQRGQAPINGVWFWGAGVLPAPLHLRFTRVFSDDALARGFALLGKRPAAPCPASAADWLALTPATSDKNRDLIVLDALHDAVTEHGIEAWRAELATLERDWFAPLLIALRGENLGMLSIHAPSPRCTLSVETIRGDLVKFWRRAQPLAAYAALQPALAS